MEEDAFDLELSPPHTRPAARQGRRAGAGGRAAPTDAFESNAKLTRLPVSAMADTDEDMLLLDNNTERPAPRGGRRAAAPGWGSAVRARTAKSVRMASAAPQVMGEDNDDEDVNDDDNDDIPVIPDLDDLREEDMNAQVAEAPSMAVNRVATMKELDNELLKHVAFATLDDIDLRPLTKLISPEASVKEADETWEWEVVFAEVSSELQRQWRPDEEEQERIEAAAERPYTAFNRFAGRK